MNTEILIMSAELKHLAEEHETIEDMFRAVVPEAHNHWMIIDEDEQFKGAVGAVLLALQEKGRDDDMKRITKELQMLRALSLIGTPGVSINFGDILDEGFEPIGLMQIWKEKLGSSHSTGE